MKPKSVAYALRYLGVAVLFAIFGAWSGSFGSSYAGLVMLPIPFALLSALLFMRTVRAILVIPLIVGVWIAAYSSAVNLSGRAGQDPYLFPICVGGLVGGLGLALSVSICHRRLLTPPFLVAALILGAVAALPFASWLRAEFSWHDGPLVRIREGCAFAIWQAVVGTCLYAVCSSGAKKESGALTAPPPPPAE